ncbi:MAG TPA: DUF6101 family protein [Beijerinckia sp.]|nr:DUF6101 family protein [Beijerinckia sp.]
MRPTQTQPFADKTMQQAKFNLDLTLAITARIAPDIRADGGHRTIRLDRRCVTIERNLRGMKMRLAVPVDHYAGVVLTCEERPKDVLYRISLAHRDPDLSIPLIETADQHDVLNAWRHWAGFFARPTLVDQGLGRLEPTGPLPRQAGFEAGLAPAEAVPPVRRRSAILSARRPRHFLRRKTGRLERVATVFRGEREIICYE